MQVTDEKDAKRPEPVLSTAALDLQRRLENDNAAPTVLQGQNPVYDNEDGFVGVSPEYQNYANDTDKPMAAEEGAEADAEERFLESATAEGGSGPSDEVKERYAAISRQQPINQRPVKKAAATQAPAQPAAQPATGDNK